MENKFIPFCQPMIGQEEIDEVVDTLKSGWLTTGPKTVRFEKMIADYTGVKYAFAVNSCTAALHLALLAADIGPGDEVITTSYTFAATANVIIQVGAQPVFVDVDRKSFNIDPEKIRKAITPRTRAIMPVHFAGQACDMGAIMEIARQHNLAVIEDAAHAIGAQYKGAKIGTFGKATCFSFYATKNMATGEGGAVVTDDQVMASRIEILRLHGMSRDAWKRYAKGGAWYYEIVDCGWKYNMTDIQAALGIHQLEKLDGFNRRRCEYAQAYRQELAKIPGIVIPEEMNYGGHVYHLFPVLIEGIDRADFIKKMGENGVQCSVHFIPLHLQPYYVDKFSLKAKDFPNAQWLYEREVSLPLYPKMSRDDIYFVVDAIKKSVAI